MAKKKPAPKAKVKIPARQNGRPSAYSAEAGDLICALLAEGKSLRKICSLDGLPSISTVLLWMVKGERGDVEYSAFSEQYRVAREAQAEFIADEIIDIADDDSRDYGFREAEDGGGSGAKAFILQDNIQRAKLRVDSRKWFASKLRPKKYGDKIQQEITGKDGGPVELSDAKATLLRGIVSDSPGSGADKADN